VLVIANASDVGALAALSDGSVLTAGGISPSDNAVIARIGPDGTLDPNFNSGGATPGVLESGMGRTPGGQTSLATASGVAAGPGGSMYVTGQVVDNGSSMRVLRLTSAGNPDPAFGNGSPATGVGRGAGGERARPVYHGRRVVLPGGGRLRQHPEQQPDPRRPLHSGRAA
jgi:hypothetical protein